VGVIVSSGKEFFGDQQIALRKKKSTAHTGGTDDQIQDKFPVPRRNRLAVQQQILPPKQQDKVGQQRKGRGQHGGFSRRPFQGDEPAKQDPQHHYQKTDQREPLEPCESLAQRRGKGTPQPQQRAAQRDQHQAFAVVKEIAQGFDG